MKSFHTELIPNFAFINVSGMMKPKEKEDVSIIILLLIIGIVNNEKHISTRSRVIFQIFS